MARLKRGSSVLEKATRRMAGMRSIDYALEFGEGLSLTQYAAHIQAVQSQLMSYNTMLSTLDEMAGQLRLMERELSGYSERMLLSVATRYGKNSLQYVQAGGKIPRRRSKRAASATPTSADVPASTTSAETNGNSTPMIMN